MRCINTLITYPRRRNALVFEVVRQEKSVGESYLFGPVLSRRLGRSLGVDIVPAKTCPYDCVYCEVARTTCHTLERRHFHPVDEILQEIADFFTCGGEADYVTITGSGEPTLCLDLGTIISEIKRRFDVRVAVITDSALLWDDEVRRELGEADIVMPSLDAARPESFEKVNRPVPGLTVEKVIEGLAAFTAGYRGKVWLEVLLVEGVNDAGEDVEALGEAISRIAPERVQLNTVVRPPAGGNARRVPQARLEEIAKRLSISAPTEVVATAAYESGGGGFENLYEAILDTVRRRPCPFGELEAGLGVDDAALRDALEKLVGLRRLRERAFGGETYYEIEAGPGSDGK